MNEFGGPPWAAARTAVIATAPLDNVGAAVPGGPSWSISGLSINGGRVAREGDPYESVRMSHCEI